MSWLIAIICIILAILFWRIVLPVALLAIVVIGLLFLYSWNNERRSERRAKARTAFLHAMMRSAEAIEDTAQRVWGVTSETDPSTGRLIPRSATVVSDNGLCSMRVEERIDRTRLVGIYCNDLKISQSDDVDVKFDTRDTSDRMSLRYFSDYRDVYIPAGQYSDRLDYDEFLRRLTQGDKVALRLTFDDIGPHWIRFALKGSDSALRAIGAMAQTNR